MHNFIEQVLQLKVKHINFLFSLENKHKNTCYSHLYLEFKMRERKTLQKKYFFIFQNSEFGF